MSVEEIKVDKRLIMIEIVSNSMFSDDNFYHLIFSDGTHCKLTVSEWVGELEWL